MTFNIWTGVKLDKPKETENHLTYQNLMDLADLHNVGDFKSYINSYLVGNAETQTITFNLDRSKLTQQNIFGISFYYRGPTLPEGEKAEYTITLKADSDSSLAASEITQTWRSINEGDSGGTSTHIRIEGPELTLLDLNYFEDNLIYFTLTLQRNFNPTSEYPIVELHYHERTTIENKQIQEIWVGVKNTDGTIEKKQITTYEIGKPSQE